MRESLIKKTLIIFIMNFLIGISPREYQQKIFETCLKKNCLVVLPTGLGKTLIALMLSIERMKEFPREKIIFLAPTRPLAEQHLKYFQKHLPELFGDMQLFTGQVNAEKRKKIWQTADLIFSTPQCIANDVKNNLYNLSEVSLLIVDEAHKCLKNYGYTYVAQEYNKRAKNKRILGLTASPGSEASKIKEICKNLLIEEVELRTRESDDVKNYLQKLEFEKIMIDFPSEFEEIRVVLKKIFDRYVNELRSQKVLFGPSTKTGLIMLQKKLMGMLLKNNQNFFYMRSISACASAIKILHAIELLETQTLKGFNIYLKKLFKEAETKRKRGIVKLTSSPEFGFAFNRSNELLAKDIEHPKIKELIEIIKKGKDKKTRVIIFAQFRDTISLISKRLNEIPEIKSKIFIGQAKRISEEGESGLNQKQQKKIIEDFSSGEINVLCSTSIGEEGLDIPEVNVVIFYEPVASAIRTIQRTGRTARLMQGKLIILITKKTRDEGYYYIAKAKEKSMYSAISAIKDELKKDSTKFSKQKTMESYF